jgi:hypothetical protein
MNYTIFSIVAITLSLALVPTIGASNVFAQAPPADFTEEIITTCENSASGKSTDGECPGQSEKSPQKTEVECKNVYNSQGKLVPGQSTC